MDASGNPVTDSSGNPVKSTIACHQITKDELENGTSLTYDLSADVMKNVCGTETGFLCTGLFLLCRSVCL